MWLVATVLGDVLSFYHRGNRRKLSNLDNVVELIGLFQYAALLSTSWVFLFVCLFSKNPLLYMISCGGNLFFTVCGPSVYTRWGSLVFAVPKFFRHHAASPKDLAGPAPRGVRSGGKAFCD